jgi:hypothetical protein|tara:strand:+ start:219 stop:629 length:411 start_codon:yes stop_codon:yes gene_type:complete
MKYIAGIFFLLYLSLGHTNHHESIENVEKELLITEIPTEYRAFVSVIGLLTPEEIVNIIGDPAKKLDLKMKSSNEVIASTWYYHNLNTDENGKYFPTTELDIIDGYVESVVFMNEVTENSKIEGQKYEVDRPENIF